MTAKSKKTVMYTLGIAAVAVAIAGVVNYIVMSGGQPWRALYMLMVSLMIALNLGFIIYFIYRNYKR